MRSLAKAQFVDRLSPQAEWRLVHKLADALVLKVARATARVMVLPETETTWARVIEQLKMGNLGQAVDAVDLDAMVDGLQQQVWPLLDGLLHQTARMVGRSTKAKASVLQKAARATFMAENPFATRWANKNAARLVVEVTNETRKAIRAYVTGASSEGVPPTKLAKQLRDVVGLTERQAQALWNARKRLMDEGVSSAVVERRMEFLATKALRDRSMVIARTETMRASNAGQVAAWQEASRDGELHTDLVKEWIVTPDDALCEECEALDGAQASFDTEFPGGVMEPPIHPNCRCAVGLERRT